MNTLLITDKPRQTGCSVGKNCRYVNKVHKNTCHNGMFCVDESFDSSEDSDEHSTGDSQEGEITVKKCLERIQL